MVLATPERKNIDTLQTLNAQAQSAWQITSQHLNDIIQGAGANSRIGRKVKMTSVQFRYNLLRTGSNGPSQCRIVLIYDRQPDGFTPQATQVFQDDLMLSPMRLENSERFRVIHDEISDSMQSSSLNISGSVYKKVNLDAVYAAGAGGGLSIMKTGALWIFASVNSTFQTGGTGNDIEIYTRVRYTDV